MFHGLGHRPHEAVARRDGVQVEEDDPAACVGVHEGRSILRMTLAPPPSAD
jgi:hypothetical protein